MVALFVTINAPLGSSTLFSIPARCQEFIGVVKHSVLRMLSNIRNLVIEDVVRALRLAAGDELAANDDPAFRKADFFPQLRELVPARLSE